MKTVETNTLSLQIRKRFDPIAPSFELQVAIEIPSGITVVFGPSGAGKTTLLECIAGLINPNAGKIAIGDEILFDSSRKINLDTRKRKIGYVFQDLALFPHLSVEKNIAYGIRDLNPNEREKRTAAILESFRISSLRVRKPSQISGGERQRVALARSLVTDPVLLMLDEPLAAIDGRTKSKLIEDLRIWNASRKIPVLYVTHSHEEAEALGDRLIILEGGRIQVSSVPV